MGFWGMRSGISGRGLGIGGRKEVKYLVDISVLFYLCTRKSTKERRKKQ